MGTSLILHLIDETAEARKLGDKKLAEKPVTLKATFNKSSAITRLDSAFNLQQQLQRSVSFLEKQ